MIPEVNERDTNRYRAVWKGDEEEPITPGTAHWRLDCSTTGNLIQDWTPVAVIEVYDDFGVITQSYSLINIPAELNVMQDRCNVRELKRLLVAADLDTSSEFKKQASYYVNNLQGRT